MEIRDLWYDARKQAYQARVCLHRNGRMVTLPATVRALKPIRTPLLTDIIMHRVSRQLGQHA